MDHFIFGILALAVIFLYVMGRYYLREGMSTNPPPVYDTTAIRADLQPDRPFVDDPIDDLDDYEVSLVFQNEGDRKAGRAAINAAMSRYPLDWTNRPPSDEKFQKYREAFVDAAASTAGQAAGTPEMQNVGGKLMTPPDQDKMDAEEIKILQMYKPEKAQDLIHYSLDDAETLVKKIYGRRGLIADVEPSKQGNNVFEIVEVRRKDEPIVWADELPPPDRYKIRGEQQIEVPQFVNDMAAGLDPYYEPRSSVRMSRNDYTKWTPGLERQFAPTYPVKNWY
jgi:hypothetical protein